MTHLNIPIDDELKKRLSKLALDKGMHKKKIVELALIAYLTKMENKINEHKK